MNNFKNKTLFITGGTGSFGKAFVKMTLKYHKPKKIIIYSRDESKQWNMKQEYKDSKKLGHGINTIKNWMYANSIHTIDFFSFLLRGKITKIENKKIQFKNSFIIISNIK